VAVLVGILGLLAAGALLVLPANVKATSGNSGFWRFSGAGHCGLPISTVIGGRKYQPDNTDCYNRARDRAVVAAVVAGVSVLGAGAAVWLLAPTRRA
jgi:hypothetical protein